MILSVIEIMNRGGVIVYVLMALSVVAWYLLFSKFVYLKRIDENATISQDNRFEVSEYLKYLLLNSKGYHLKKNINMVATIYTMAPLLGLLGTVRGMINTFDIIKIFGNTNPVLMSEGISVALITTQAGLITAFPLMLFYGYLINRINTLQNSI